MKLYLLLSLAVFLAGSMLAGDLKWEQGTIEVKAAKGQKKVEVEFRFTNTSTAPVKIQSVQTSCGCTSAQMPKKEYQPNESGTLKVVFSPEGRKGLQKKSIVVRTDSSQTPDVLILKVQIPDICKIDKERLSWPLNSPRDAQFVELTPESGPFEVRSVRSLSSDFVATLEPKGDAGSYRVKVIPQSTEKAVRTKLAIEISEPEKRSLYLILEVQ